MDVTSKIIKVIIADDHVLFADGLEQIVNSTNGFEVIAKMTNGKTLMQALNSLHPDLILLDINMPLMDGLETSLLIKKKFQHLKIIFISMHFDARYKIFFKKNDIDGFFIKNISAPELREALIKVVNGHKVFISPVEAIAPPIPIPETDYMKMYKLTRTEIGIIQLIAEGCSTKMIADKKNLSHFTVESHRKNIFRKLNAKNMADLVAFAVIQGIYKKDD